MTQSYIDKIHELESKINELENALVDALRFKEAIAAAGFDVWENNLVTGEVFGTNRQLFLSLGYSEEELPKTVEDTFSKIHPEDLAKALQKVQEHVDGYSDRYKAEMRIKAKDGSWVWTGSYGQVLKRNDEGNVTSILGLSFNIDQRRIMEETMKELAYTDALTGLGNRRLLMESGSHEVERSLRYNHNVVLLLIDLDNYKTINDTYGHVVGDEVLVKFAQCLTAEIRDIDIKVRYGGDEFILLLIETDESGAYDTVHRLQKAVSRNDFGIVDKLTISIGLTSLKPDDSLSNMIIRSDEALYNAKRLGKNQVVVT